MILFVDEEGFLEKPSTKLGYDLWDRVSSKYGVKNATVITSNKPDLNFSLSTNRVRKMSVVSAKNANVGNLINAQMLIITTKGLNDLENILI